MLLSICIPTYNRAEYLEKTLESIVSQESWSESDAEIVISDNASTDRTPEVTARFCRLFPEKIRSVRQEKIIDAHLNFEEVMRAGSGTFLKLNNDTLSWKKGMLKEYLSLLEKHRDSADLILTPNSPMAPGYGKVDNRCAGMDDVLLFCSYFLTWIGCFGVRREVFLGLEEPSRNIESRLTQTDMILRLISAGNRTVTDGRLFFETLPIVRNTDYQIAEVFCRNYFNILGEYLGRGISKSVFEVEKKRMLFDFLLPGYFNFFGYHGVEQRGYWKYTAIYHRNIYFYLSFIKVAGLWLVSRFFSREYLRKVKNFIFGRKNPQP